MKRTNYLGMYAKQASTYVPIIYSIKTNDLGNIRSAECVTDLGWKS